MSGETMKVTVKVEKLKNLLKPYDGVQFIRFDIKIPGSITSYTSAPIIIKDERDKIPDKGIGEYVPKTSTNNHIDKLMLRLWGAITDYIDDDKDEANISNLLKAGEIYIGMSERYEFMRKLQEVLAAGRRLSFSFGAKRGR